MGMYIKQQDSTLRKIAGYTVVGDGSCAEVRKGTWTINVPSTGGYSTTVTFTDPMPDTDYEVILEQSQSSYAGDVNIQLQVQNKTVDGFQIYGSFQISTGGDVSGNYAAIKLIPMEGYTEIKTKVENPDAAPTENSTNLVESGGVWEAIKNASAIWKGTAAGWESELHKTDFDVAILTDTHMILAVNRLDGSTSEQANLNKIFRGTQAEWDALTQQEQDYYDQAEIEEDSYVSVPGTLIVANNSVVAAADWVPDATYTGYGYKAAIPVTDVTADYSPDVRFGFDDAMSGKFASIADTGAGVVNIYASEVPATDITIPVIICTLMSV